MITQTKAVALNDLFEAEVKRRKLEKLSHVSVPGYVYNHILFQLNMFIYPDYKPTSKISDELKQQLRAYKIRNAAEIVKADVHLCMIETKNIWPRSKGTEAYLNYEPVDLEIGIPGTKKKFFVWTVYKESTQNSGDDLWAFLSFEDEDRQYITAFLEIIDRLRIERNVEEKWITVFGGSNIKIRGTHTWDDLILPDRIIRSVKDDLEFWMRMEDHYKEKKIPYRRGYLFEGPPGNGKTATARTIMSTYDFTGFMFNFSNCRLDDSDLMSAFEQATNEAPSLFLLEDIDRVFDRQHFCNISLECLFNCLDGIAVNEGLVVIATANNPETLDKAIRHRPGRFDVPVRFENPTDNQRARYFSKMFENALHTDTFDRLVVNTAGLSMAFLKLVYETAGVNAFKRIINGTFKITDEDALAGLALSLEYYDQMAIGDDRAAGFRPKRRRRNPRYTAKGEDCATPVGKTTGCPGTDKSKRATPVRRKHPTIHAPGSDE